MVDRIDWPRGTKTDANRAKKVIDLRQYAEDLVAEPGDGEDRGRAASAILSDLDKTLGERSLMTAAYELLKPRIPRFLYFAEYRHAHGTSVTRCRFHLRTIQPDSGGSFHFSPHSSSMSIARTHSLYRWMSQHSGYTHMRKDIS